MRNAAEQDDIDETAGAPPIPGERETVGDVDTDGGTTQQAGVQSVEIAAHILKALAGGGGPLPLKSVAKAARMSRAKVHRYLVSLKRAGLVAQEARSGEYRIGPAAVTLGLVGLLGLSPIRAVNEALPALRDRIEETVTLAIWGEAGPVVIAMEEPSRPITVNVRIGSILPISTSAIGRAFAALLPDLTTRDLIGRERALAMETGAAVPDRDALDEILAEVRAKRMARARGTVMAGIDALAAPVFDHTGKTIAVVCAFGRAGAFDSRWTGRNAQILRETTSDLSRQFGFAEVLAGG
jgi:DNA-binding IclR family transcriptional regulator